MILAHKSLTMGSLLFLVVNLGVAVAIGPFNLTAKIATKSLADLKEFVEKGSRSHLDVNVTYSSELGLPEEAALCTNSTGM